MVAAAAQSKEMGTSVSDGLSVVRNKYFPLAVVPGGRE